MLSRTFLHLSGIGPKKELALWKAGIFSWDQYERTLVGQRSLFADDQQSNAQHQLELSRRALELGDFDFFAERLPRSEHFRIALTSPKRVVFLDVETTGLSHYYDHLTLVGIGHNGSYSCCVRGSSRHQITEILAEAACLVTFNGTAFDLKFLRKEWPEVRLPKAHVDLRFLAKRVGLAGGQKAIEKTLG